MEKRSRVEYPTSQEPVMVKRYHVHLSDDQRLHVEQIVSRGKTRPGSLPALASS